MDRGRNRPDRIGLARATAAVHAYLDATAAVRPYRERCARFFRVFPDVLRDAALDRLSGIGVRGCSVSPMSRWELVRIAFLGLATSTALTALVLGAVYAAVSVRNVSDAGGMTGHPLRTDLARSPRTAGAALAETLVHGTR